MKKIIFILAIIIIANYSFLTDDCQSQWVSDIRLTNATGNSFTSLNNARCIATNGNFLHAVFEDYRDGNDEIYYKRSIDGGTNWEADLRLTNNTSNSIFPSLAVSGSQVHLVWQEYRDGNWEIYYKRSQDGGTTWSADTRLTNNTADSFNPSIAISNSQINVVWTDFRDNYNGEIYYKRSTDSGMNWDTDTRLTNNPALSYYPSITATGSQVHVVWYDNRDGNNEIYYKRSQNGGTTWETDTRLTNDTAISYSPSVAVNGLKVHIVWFDFRDGNWEIYYKRSTDGGTIWNADTRLTNNSAKSIYPSIAVSGSQVNVVWQDERDGNPNTEIYFKRSTDGGTIWDADTRLTNNNASSIYPSIAVSGSQINVVWSCDRDSIYNNEIYFKRNPTGNVGIQNISSEIPSKYSLSQNYPNPFNNTSNFKFEIAKLGEVKIIVYDVMGREVQTLVNESLKPGTYETTLDGSQLTSGVYFYKMITDGFSETKRMILLR